MRFLRLLMLLFLAGCASEFNLATQQEESLIYGTDKEIKIGDAMARQFDSNFKINTDIDINDRIERIFLRIVDVCDRQDLVYTVKVIDEDKVNAISLPGGYVYIYKGLIDKAKSDDEIAGVLAHEVGHIAARHSIKRLQASYGYALLSLGAAVGTQNGNVVQGINAAFMSAFTEYSLQDEFEADRLGVKYLTKAKYDPKAMKSMLAILKKEEDKAPIREISYWRTHPYLTERIATVNQQISGTLEFSDYLDLIGNE